MESVFVVHADVKSPVLSLGLVPLRFTLSFVIEKGRKAEQLGLAKRLEDRPKQDLAFKIIFKPDLLQLMCQLS